MTAQAVSPLPPSPTPHRAPIGGGRITLVVVGSIAALLGLVLVVVGGFLASMGRWGDDRYLETGPGRFTTDTYAVSVPGVDIDVAGPEVAFVRDLLGAVRVQARGNDAEVPVFIGIGPSEDVAAYLSGVGHAEVADLEMQPFEVDYRTVDGGAPAGPPAEQGFWAASDSGPGARTLDWDVTPGDWTVVVMNADGSAGVDADLILGGSLPVVGWVGAGVVAAGLVMLLVGVALVVVPLATRGARTA